MPVRNAAVMVAQRGVQAAGGLLFVALVPRKMGPGLFGLRIVTLHELAAWPRPA